jgi:hypothetical protein
VLLSSMWGIEVAQVKAAASSVNSSLIILSRAKAIDHARKPTAAEGMWQCGENTYKANDACDCACGQYDPDCDDPRLETRGCPEKDMVRKPPACLRALGSAQTNSTHSAASAAGDHSAHCESHWWAKGVMLLFRGTGVHERRRNVFDKPIRL